jgi:2-polyprenyl-6-methoxyphenol hydroxylase-like FAD-dependent oxidoreductase
MSSAAQSFDVVFAGGGIVGTACVYACAQAGMRVALVEATFLAAAQRPALDDCRFHFPADRRTSVVRQSLLYASAYQ